MFAKYKDKRIECLKEREMYIIKRPGGSQVALTDEPPSRSRERLLKQTDELQTRLQYFFKSGSALANFFENYGRLLPCRIYTAFKTSLLNICAVKERLIPSKHL